MERARIDPQLEELLRAGQQPAGGAAPGADYRQSVLGEVPTPVTPLPWEPGGRDPQLMEMLRAGQQYGGQPVPGRNYQPQTRTGVPGWAARNAEAMREYERMLVEESLGRGR